ncbi:MAG: hypothetical protein DHS20C09_17930 [marine bacterium B5-7]|nr:MAG: hypothetical protein DHS20C09_17930 [marine bacterium B5-7]
MIKNIIILFLMLSNSYAIAGGDQSTIYSISTERPGEEVYQSVYKSLEESRFYVIFEANIGKNLARNAERWGEEYNKNKFEFVKSMVVCNPYFTNQVMNLDPGMMSLCPLNITVMSKAGKSTVLFEKLTPVAKGSPAEDVLWEIENTIITAIENALGL